MKTFMIIFLIDGWFPSGNYYVEEETEKLALDKCYRNLPKSYQGYEYKCYDISPKYKTTIFGSL